MNGWFKRQSSMRGRLSLLLMAVVVIPMVGAGAVAWQIRASAELDDEGHVRSDELQALPLLNVSRAALATEHEMDDSLRDLLLRATRLDGHDAAAVEAAFGDLPVPAQPSLVVVLGRDGTSEPAAVTRRQLAGLVESARPESGYAMLPAPGDLVAEGADAVPWPHQVAVVPRPDGQTLVIARPLDSSWLFGDLPGGELMERGLVLLDGAGRPLQSSTLPGGFDAELVDRATRGVAGTDAFRESGEHGAVAAVPVRDPAGRPLALALVRHDVLAAPPLLRRQTALLSSMLSILGLMCAVGVLAAVAMGVLAPRLVWRDIRTSTDFIFRSVDRLRELVQRNQGALDEQSRLTRSLLGSVASLEAASRDILRTAGALAHKAEQSAWVSQTGNQKAELAQRSVLEVRERVMDLSSQMEELGRRCDEIGSLTSFINHLSTETNALSINATIQAAGSGGSGRQFNVMAGEIQRLADLSQDSTRDINHLVERIQEASRATLGASKEGCDKVDRAKACCEELEGAFARILRWVEETTQSARGIEHSTEEQAGSLKEVGQAIEQLEQRSRFTTNNFQDIVLAADELAELGSRMNETWKVG